MIVLFFLNVSLKSDNTFFRTFFFIQHDWRHMNWRKMRLTNNGLYFLPQFFNLYFWFCCCYLTGELIILVITNLWDQVCGFLYNACIYTTYVCLIIPDFRLLLRFFVVPKWCYRTFGMYLFVVWAFALFIYFSYGFYIQVIAQCKFLSHI